MGERRKIGLLAGLLLIGSGCHKGGIPPGSRISFQVNGSAYSFQDLNSQYLEYFSGGRLSSFLLNLSGAPDFSLSIGQNPYLRNQDSIPSDTVISPLLVYAFIFKGGNFSPTYVKLGFSFSRQSGNTVDGTFWGFISGINTQSGISFADTISKGSFQYVPVNRVLSP